MGNVELHFHLLPGVDDGPASLEESVELARVAVSEGTDTIVATPHVNRNWVTDVRVLDERVAELTRRLRRERVPLKVLRGAELDPEMVARLSHGEFELIAQGPRGRRWLLLEAPFAGLNDTFTAAADELRARGFAVVVAHPERSAGNLNASLRVLHHELAAGSAMQLNAWSIAGLYGDRVRLLALQLLKVRARVAVASDAHGSARMPSLGLALDALAALGVKDARRLVTAVPRSLLQLGLSANRVAAAA